MQIKKALLQDHVALSVVTKLSKAYWGYSAEQIQKWDKDLTITPKYIDENVVYKLMQEQIIIGYYSYVRTSETSVKLDNLFVQPAYIGRGLGKKLLLHCIQNAKKEKILTVTLNAEPKAKEFYEKFNFVEIDSLKSSIKGRFLPVMQLQITG